MAMDREARNAYQRAYRAANRDKVAANALKWKTENREKLALQQREWVAGNPEKAATSTQKYREAYPERQAVSNRKAKLKRRFNLTLEQYDRMAKDGCQICGALNSTSGRRLDVDHDHNTGDVRGILCNSCNLALGSMSDNPDRLRLAAAYLERFEHVNHCD